MRRKSTTNIKNRLKMLRGGLSQKQFAEKLGVPFWSYCRYETDERTPPIDVLLKISNSEKKSINWILTGIKIKDDGGTVNMPDSLRNDALIFFDYMCISCRFKIEEDSFFDIIDFRKSKKDEKIRLADVICLCPNCHKLLDLGLIPYKIMNAYKAMFTQYKKQMDSKLKKRELKFQFTNDLK